MFHIRFSLLLLGLLLIQVTNVNAQNAGNTSNQQCLQNCTNNYIQDILQCGDNYASCRDSILLNNGITVVIDWAFGLNVCRDSLSTCQAYAQSTLAYCETVCSSQVVEKIRQRRLQQERLENNVIE